MVKPRPANSNTRLMVALIGVLSVAVGILLVMSITRRLNAPKADPNNVSLVAQGQQVYAAQCASCHGVNLEGQPNWKDDLATGGKPAPPHDATGHTWHHADEPLFGIIKNGGQAYSPASYKNNMPAFGSKLSDDEIWATMAYIKSRWSAEIQVSQVARQK